MKKSFESVALFLALALCLRAISPECAAVTRVRCCGDSITELGYPTYLQNDLGSGYAVTNAGHSGDTATKLGTRIYPDAVNPRDDTDICIFMLGTNDTKKENWPTYKVRFVSDYVACINTYKALPSHPKIYLNLSPPIYLPEPSGSTGFSPMNLEEAIPLMQQVAQQTGATVIDVHAAMSGHPELFQDGVHPNDAGKSVLAKTVANGMGVTVVIPPPTTYEAEALSVAQSSGDTYRIITDTRLSGGEAGILDSNAVGDYLIYTVPNVQAGIYNVKVGVKKFPARGIVQLFIQPAGGGGGSNVGSAQDQYAATDTFTEVDLGTWTPGSNGNKWFKFSVTGKNASSTGYSMCFDYIKLTPQ